MRTSILFQDSFVGAHIGIFSAFLTVHSKRFRIKSKILWLEYLLVLTIPLWLQARLLYHKDQYGYRPPGLKLPMAAPDCRSDIAHCSFCVSSALNAPPSHLLLNWYDCRPNQYLKNPIGICPYSENVPSSPLEYRSYTICNNDIRHTAKSISLLQNNVCKGSWF